MLTQPERVELLAIAREAITKAVRSETPAPPSAQGGRLAEPGGAFVTIRHRGELRGCIGYIESALPLCQVVHEVAVKAAREDPRFPPVNPDELEDLALEVSVLSPLEPVKDVDDIRVSEHGILIELGWNRGLLLPQVAVEYRWGREEFLGHAARKAGLPPRAWGDPRAKLYRFSAEVFHEEQNN